VLTAQFQAFLATPEGQEAMKRMSAVHANAMVQNNLNNAMHPNLTAGAQTSLSRSIAGAAPLPPLQHQQLQQQAQNIIQTMQHQQHFPQAIVGNQGVLNPQLNQQLQQSLALRQMQDQAQQGNMRPQNLTPNQQAIAIARAQMLQAQAAQAQRAQQQGSTNYSPRPPQDQQQINKPGQAPVTKIEVMQKLEMMPEQQREEIFNKASLTQR
jgi:hypothetical protein